MALTLLLEVIDVEIRDNEISLLLDPVLVPLLDPAGEHDHYLLFGYVQKEKFSRNCKQGTSITLSQHISHEVCVRSFLLVVLFDDVIGLI